MRISVQDLASSIGMETDFLIGRRDGERFAGLLVERLHMMGAEETLLLDFDGVDLMDGSFADEVFAALATKRSQGELGDGPVVLSRLNMTSLDNLEQALLSRPVREQGLRNCVVPTLSANNKLELCGKSEEHVKQTFMLLNRHGELTTKMVADLLDLTIPAASTRLKALFDLGLALRTETRDSTGKQFVYRKLM